MKIFKCVAFLFLLLPFLQADNLPGLTENPAVTPNVTIASPAQQQTTPAPVQTQAIPLVSPQPPVTTTATPLVTPQPPVTTAVAPIPPENQVTTEGLVKEKSNVTTDKGPKTVVGKGDKIKISYEGKLRDGSIFDSKKEDKPLSFEVGKGSVLKGIDNGVIGMKLNEEKELEIKADDAYGQRDENKKIPFPLKKFPKDYKLEKGMIIMLADPNSGNQFPAIVTDITGDKVMLDMNHFLAGKDLFYKVKIISIE